MSPDESSYLRRAAGRVTASSGLRGEVHTFLKTARISSSLVLLVESALSEGSPASLNEQILAVELVPLIAIGADSALEASLQRILDRAPEPDSSIIHALWVFCFFPFIAPLSPIIEQGRRNRLRVAAARSLGRMDSIAAIGALSRALGDAPGISRTWACGEVRAESGRALTSLLPELNIQNRRLLDHDTVSNLSRALPKCREDLALAILAAFHHVAGGEAVRDVELTAKKAESPRVRAAASELLPHLQRIREEERASTSLLRSADPENRLRPALDSPARWLRPSDRAA